MNKNVLVWTLVFCPGFLLSCGKSDPVSPERYGPTDALISGIKANIERNQELELIADIDHSRLGSEAGSPMPPSRVVIFSNAELETALIRLNPLTALDLPLRLLAYELDNGKDNGLIYNTFDYLVSRYQLEEAVLPDLRASYNQTMNTALMGVSQEAVRSFEDDSMQPDGITTLESPYNFEETIKRVNDAIEAQDDTVHFGTVDFQANTRDLDIEIGPSYMILFGGPGPGGKAMAEATTLGLDGFCQKFLIWEDSSGRVFLSFNDLLALADRQGVKKNLPLRVINRRLTKVFAEALAN